MNCWSFYLILVFITAFVYQSSGEKCNEDDLNKCLDAVISLIGDLDSLMKRNETELDIYCGTVHDSECLLNAASSCKKEHPLKAATAASLVNYLEMMCKPGSNQRSTLFKVSPCVDKHDSDFKVCEGISIVDVGNGHAKHEELKALCTDMEEALCYANVSREVCGKDGEMHAETAENNLGDIFKDVCTSSGEHCNEDNLKKCLDTLRSLVDEQVSLMKKNKSELDIYCGRVEEDGKCLLDAASPCNKEHPLIAASTASLVNYLKMICKPGINQGSKFFKLLPCFDKYDSEFKVCEDIGSEDVGNEHVKDEELKTLCTDMEASLCFANVSREVCGKDGELYAESVENGLGDTYKDVCTLFYHSSTDYCNQDSANECIEDMQMSLTAQSEQKDKSNRSDVCEKFKERSKCLQNATVDCRKHPLIVVTSASLSNYIELLCLPGTNQEWLFTEIRPCMDSNSMAVKCGQASQQEHIQTTELQLKCRELKSALCLAGMTRQYCEKGGEKFAEAIEYNVKDIYQDFCFGDGSSSGSSLFQSVSRVINICFLVCVVVIGYFRQISL